MEKKIEFLQSRTVAQLSNAIVHLSRYLDYIVRILEPITSDSDPRFIAKHDVDCLNVIFLCDSLNHVVDELKFTFV